MKTTYSNAEFRILVHTYVLNVDSEIFCIHTLTSPQILISHRVWGEVGHGPPTLLSTTPLKCNTKLVATLKLDTPQACPTA
jgi:hypothetical protein